MSFFNVLFSIFVKDFKDEIRRKENIFSSFFFALLSLVLFHFAVDVTSIEISKEGSGLLWLIIIFAGTIFISNIFKKEEENGTFYALLLAPVDRFAIYLGKFLVSLIFLLILEIFLFILFVFFFNISLFTYPFSLLILLVLVNVGFSSLGTLISSLLVNQKSSTLLYPLLLYPLLFPLFLAAIVLTESLLKNELSFSNVWLSGIIFFDILFFAVSIILFEFSMEE